jgi:hypothetical protein
VIFIGYFLLIIAITILGLKNVDIFKKKEDVHILRLNVDYKKLKSRGLVPILRSNEIICGLIKLHIVAETYLYTGFGVGVGFIGASAIFLYQWIKFRRKQKSLEGFLESEKLIRERFQKENTQLHLQKETTQSEHELKIQQLHDLIKIMDEDILLLQKSNEETEALLKAGDPMVHSLKLKLIEANNTIARYKGQMLVK